MQVLYFFGPGLETHTKLQQGKCAKLPKASGTSNIVIWPLQLNVSPRVEVLKEVSNGFYNILAKAMSSHK